MQERAHGRPLHALLQALATPRGRTRPWHVRGAGAVRCPSLRTRPPPANLCPTCALALLAELNDLLASGADGRNHAAISATLSAESRAVFELLPSSFRAQLLGERDPHGNVQASAAGGGAGRSYRGLVWRPRCCARMAPAHKARTRRWEVLQAPMCPAHQRCLQVSAIETEKLLVQLVEAELAERKAAGTYSGKFATTTHFFGYEGRCAHPPRSGASCRAPCIQPATVPPDASRHERGSISDAVPVSSLSDPLPAGARCPATLTPPTATAWARQRAR